MIFSHHINTFVEKIVFFTPKILEYGQGLLKQITKFLSFVFPVLLSIAFVTVNFSIISGAIIYLLDYNEENGKIMVLRSLVILLLLIILFDINYLNSIIVMKPLNEFQSITSFIISYMLFILATLSLIIFIGNLGLFLISGDFNRKKTIKKSFICLVCILLPLGFQFPNMPVWMI